MTFTRCTSLPFIKMYLTQPVFWKALHDDYAGKPEDWNPQPSDSQYVAYVNIHDDDGTFLGIAIFSLHSQVQVEIHNALLPWVGWKKRVQVGREFFAWLWSAGRKRIIGKVIASNRYAIAYNKAIGMEEFGVNKKAFLKDGVLYDEHWFGISPPESK